VKCRRTEGEDLGHMKKQWKMSLEKETTAEKIRSFAFFLSI